MSDCEYLSTLQDRASRLYEEAILYAIEAAPCPPEQRSAKAVGAARRAMVGELNEFVSSIDGRRLLALAREWGHPEPGRYGAPLFTELNALRNPDTAGAGLNRVRELGEELGAMAMFFAAPGAPETGADPETEKAAPHLDGPEGGRWVWWKGTRHEVPTGVIYRFIAYMWNRDSAKYDNLMNASDPSAVFESEQEPQSIRSATNRANDCLRKIGVPWGLKADAKNRFVIKDAAKPKRSKAQKAKVKKAAK